jgi:hypothetical protein
MAASSTPIKNNKNPSSKRLKLLIVGAAASLALIILLIGIPEIRAYVLFYLFGQWSEILERNVEFSTEPRISAAGSNVYLTWIEKNGNNFDLMFAESEDNGKTFAKPLRLDDETVTPQAHQMVLDKQSGHIHVLWFSSNPQVSDGSSSLIYYTRSIDGGNTFDKFKLITNDTRMPYREYAKMVVSDGKFVNIFWSSSAFNLTHIRSTDSGATFGKPEYFDRYSGVANASVHQIDTVTSNNDRINLLWSENWYTADDYGGRVYLRTSTDKGASFGEPVLITDMGSGFSLAVSDDGMNVYVAWNNDSEYGSGDMIVRASTDGGAAFGPIMNISSNSEHFLPSDIAASSPLIGKSPSAYLAWYEGTYASYDDNDRIISGSTNEMKFKQISVEDDRYELAGKTIELTDVDAGWHAFDADILVGSDNTIHVMLQGFIDPRFLDGERPNEVFYSQSNDGGASFAKPDNISMMLGNSKDARIEASDDNVYIVWAQEVPIAEQREIGREVLKSNIIFKASTDKGNTFGESMTIS